MAYFSQEKELVCLLRSIIGLPAESWRKEEFTCGHLQPLKDFTAASSCRNARGCGLNNCLKQRNKIPQALTELQKAYALSPLNLDDVDSLIGELVENYENGSPHSAQLKLDSLAYVAAALEEICALVTSIYNSNGCGNDQVVEILTKAHLCARIIEEIYKKSEYFSPQPPNPISVSHRWTNEFRS